MDPCLLQTAAESWRVPAAASCIVEFHSGTKMHRSSEIHNSLTSQNCKEVLCQRRALPGIIFAQGWSSNRLEGVTNSTQDHPNSAWWVLWLLIGWFSTPLQANTGVVWMIGGRIGAEAHLTWRIQKDVFTEVSRHSSHRDVGGPLLPGIGLPTFSSLHS